MNLFLFISVLGHRRNASDYRELPDAHATDVITCGKLVEKRKDSLLKSFEKVCYYLYFGYFFAIGHMYSKMLKVELLKAYGVKETRIFFFEVFIELSSDQFEIFCNQLVTCHDEMKVRH